MELLHRPETSSHGSGRVNRQSIRTAAYQRRTLLQEASTWWCPEQLIPRFIGRKGQNLRALEAGRAKITLLNGQICVPWREFGFLYPLAEFAALLRGLQVSNGISRRAERDVTDDIESWLLEQGVPAQCLVNRLAHVSVAPWDSCCFNAKVCKAAA